MGKKYSQFPKYGSFIIFEKLMDTRTTVLKHSKLLIYTEVAF
jgi:hypothetical protein